LGIGGLLRLSSPYAASYQPVALTRAPKRFL
jgi:hypothetical protein